MIRCAKQVGSQDYAIYGQEVNGSTWALAKMNMFLHEINGMRIDWTDTIKEPTLLENDRLMQFNVVTANPPFSLDKWGKEDAEKDRYNRFHRGTPPASKGDYAFISHMIEVANMDKGRVGVIVPHGVLFRGSSEGKIRQQLLEENLLDAVIGLPPNLFFGTGIPAAILLFKRQKVDDTVLFIEASREFEAGTTQNNLRPQDLAKIVQTYQSRQTLERYSYVASFAEIKENDFNLNIPRYVDTFEPEPEIDMMAVQQEIEDIEAELRTVEGEMQEYLRELGL